MSFEPMPTDNHKTSATAADQPSKRKYLFTKPTRRRSRGPHRSVLAAAFAGLSIALGWENEREQSEIAVENPHKDDWTQLSYGSLEPLDE